MAQLLKVGYDEYVKTTEMFYVNENLEVEINREVSKSVDTLCKKMQEINTIDGLKRYIRSDEKSLENLISLMNISSEKFKRVITALRLEKGHEIAGEWNIDKVRSIMLERPAFMDEVCDLLMNGATSAKYSSKIPQFYLENFVINSSTMARLYNPDDLRRLIKKGIEGRYNSGIGAAYFTEVEKAVKTACFEEGVTYAVNKQVSLINRVADFVIPNEFAPRVIIDISYNITTSSTQTKYKDAEEDAASKIRAYNANASNPVALVNVLDGAGWVGRQSDLRAIHLCSTYMLHRSTLSMMQEIIHMYC